MRSRPKVLVLDAETSAALAVVQSLGRLGAEIHTLAKSRSTSDFSRYVTRRIPAQQHLEPVAYGALIQSLQEREKYELIVPASEISLRALQALGPSHELRATAVLPSHQSVEIALDKIRTRTLAERLGVPTPQARILQRDGSDPPQATYPVVLKPERSQFLVDGTYHYAQPAVVRDSATRERALEEWLPRCAVEEQDYVPGRGWGVNCLYRSGRLVWHFTHERLHELPLTGGASCYRRSARPSNTLLDAARTLLDALEWHGVAMVEFRVDEESDRFTLMEINPRLWGSLPVAVRSGVDFPRGLLSLAQGSEFSHEQPAYRIGYRMRVVPKDLEWIRENWTADREDPLLLTGSRKLSLFEWILPILRVEGWDHFSWRDPGPGLALITDLTRRFVSAIRKRLSSRWRQAQLRRLHTRNLKRWLRFRTSTSRVNFVCYGNICRSPLAENVARAAHSEWSVTSTGLHATPGRQTPPRIVRAAMGASADLAPHRARLISGSDVEQADLLVVMDPTNLTELLKRFPSAREKVILLGLAADPPVMTVPDPISLSEEGILDSVTLVRDAVTRLASI